MNVTFNTLKKDDILYILDLENFSVKKSVVISNDRQGIFTPYITLTSNKLANKMGYSNIVVDKQYCTTCKEDLMRELKFLIDKNESNLRDAQFQINYFNKHPEVEEAKEETKKLLETSQNNIRNIKATIEAL